MSPLLDGKGGGRAEAAQATGNNPSGVAEALKKATLFVQTKLGVGSDLSSETAKLGLADK